VTRLSSYWHDSAEGFSEGAEPPAQVDVAVIGGGFTGLGAARRLAMAGRSVAVLEARQVGFGASGRNGGHLNNGLAHSYLAARAAFGPERAQAMWRAFDDGIDTIRRIIAEEGIACDFRLAGKLKLASKPAHMDSLIRNFEVIRAEVDPDVALLGRADLAAEIGSGIFHGAMLQKRSAMMHMGRFVAGLAAAAARRGAVVVENAPVTAITGQDGAWRLTTPRGTVAARQVLLATGAYTGALFPWFRRRLVPVGSFLIATRPLSQAEAQAIMPGNRTCVNSMNIGNYWRLSPDNRLIFGGRARFSARSDQTSDAKAGAILRAAMLRVFPQLDGVAVDHCWGGLVDMTADRYPRAGQAKGLWHAMGYSGHGAQLATHLGEIVADQMTGARQGNPFDHLPWPAVPGHTGSPWFLPLVGMYYRALDLVK
jgi:glycine/D-amino acid oxidase-like deaminating enzyme